MSALETGWCRVVRPGDEPDIRTIRIYGHDAGASASVLRKFCGQATKGAWWMPWQKQAMKDVASCDKPR